LHFLTVTVSFCQCSLVFQYLLSHHHCYLLTFCYDGMQFLCISGHFTDIVIFICGYVFLPILVLQVGAMLVFTAMCQLTVLKHSVTLKSTDPLPTLHILSGPPVSSCDISTYYIILHV